MIQFFRKIREKLLSENKFRKYLLYALGEILLITIGLLLALNINNWNEMRKEHKEGTEYLIELKGELNRNLDRLNYVLYGGYHDNWGDNLVKLDSIKPYLFETTSPDTLITSLLYISVVPNTDFAMQKNIYQEGIATGELSRIETAPTSKTTLFSVDQTKIFDGKKYQSSSKDLKVHIHFYYSWMKMREKQVGEKSAKRIESELQASALEGAVMDLVYQARKNKVGFNEFLEDQNRRDAFIRAYPWILDRSSPEFQNALHMYHQIKSEQGSKSFFISEFLPMTENLIELIDEEIARRN